ncbi:RNA polymerase sigma factor [Auritidibacter sp. NML120636]|uniref:RNA polymerase sigma factor n=1 Tax=Auritidibacter sp. NML120636 TaxID=2170743 RepID=UPI000D73E615|nr:sigma-70 family RNA polymerase sigma factor [Auritidibacter sp. NML120636]PXA79796.1 RNA polymerase subunit sigma-24 [Auritidibacter sp. NML120636]
MSDRRLEPGDPSDLCLLRRVGAGDERALEHLYDRYGHVVFGFALSRTTDRGLAEEVPADVWLGYWRSAHAFRGESKVLTWLLDIAARQVSTHTRRRRLRLVPLEEAGAPAAPESSDPATAALAADGERTLRDALEQLPEDLAMVVKLAWLHELPHSQIALVLEIPTDTVKNRVSRARQLLQESVRRQDA